MKKKHKKTSRGSAGSSASPRRSKGGTARPTKAFSASKQPTTKRPSPPKPTTRSGSSSRKKTSGSRAPVARVSFQHQPTLTARELKKVVGDLLRNELMSTAKWLLQQNQILLDSYFGNTPTLFSDGTPIQTESIDANVSVDANEPQADLRPSQDESHAITPADASEGKHSASSDRLEEALQAAAKIFELKQDFKKYKPLDYLLMMYVQNAVAGTTNRFQQTATGWPSPRSTRKMLKAFVKHRLIQGYGDPIFIDPDLIKSGKRKAPHRFKGYQLTDLGVAAIKVLIPWIDAVPVDFSRKPVEIPQFLNRGLRLERLP